MGLVKNFFIEVQKSARGKTRFHILEILRGTMKCNCFGVDCCKGYMRIPTVDDSTKVYMWIEGDAPVYGTLAEAEAASAAGKAARAACTSCG
jgi:hypothetical protein